MSKKRILILGGNRFFGKKLAQNLIEEGHEITLLNRQSMEDGLGNQVQRIKADRNDFQTLQSNLKNSNFDIVYDQICYQPQQALDAIQLFQDQVGHYVFTSTKSVYTPQPSITEDFFNPLEHSLQIENQADYGEGKRQCEAVFFQKSKLPITAVRFPIVMGPNDYTQRLIFHVSRIQQSEEIYFPNTQAQISFVHEFDAARALHFIGLQSPQGPINVASPEPIALNKLIEQIERRLDKKCQLTNENREENHSPYGIPDHWFMDTTKLHSLGLQLPPIGDWLCKEILNSQNK